MLRHTLNLEESDERKSVSSESLLAADKDQNEEEERSLNKLSKKLNKLFSNKSVKSEFQETFTTQVVFVS
jgi:hypothetical protein